MTYENKDAFGRADAPPAPPELAQLARPFVEGAALRFKKFKEDLERIESAAIKALDRGELSRDAASQIWWDRDNVVSRPLQQRYLEARRFELLAAWHRARDVIQMADWPDPLAREALEGMIALGGGVEAAALARYHIDRFIRSLRQDWRERRRGQPKKLDEGARALMRGFQQALIARVPRRNAELLLDIATLEPIIRAHGDADDIAFLERVGDEVRGDQRRFPAEPAPL